MIRYFSLVEGVKNQLIDLHQLSNETSNTLCGKIMETCEKYELNQKFVCFSADNCPSNFGSHKRGGENNVFFHLKKEHEENLFGLGCNAHVLNNGLNSACI